MNNAAIARDLMIKTQLETCAMQNETIISALEKVNREDFIPEEFYNLAYVDDDIPLGRDRSLMAVLPFAQIIEASEIKASDNVLIVGCNLGYSAAVLAELSNHVTAVEDYPELVNKARKNLCQKSDKIEVVTTPLTGGCKTHAPYDVIIIEGAVENIGNILPNQLAEGGRLVTIKSTVRHHGTNSCMGRVLIVRKQGNQYIEQLGNDINGSILANFTKNDEFSL